MDASEMRELLRGYLSELDWSGGTTKDHLIAHLAGRDEALRTMLNQYVAEGTYAGLDEVLSVIPAQAWQDVQGDAWRGAESQYAEDVSSGFAKSPVGQDTGGIHHAGGPPPATPGFGHSVVGNGGQIGNSLRASAEAERLAAPASPLARGTQSMGSSPMRLVPVALSALAEGFGQAYNRQPAKAAGLLLLGLGLSTASGLNTWLVRRVPGAKHVTIGADRIRPLLLAAWAITYAFNLWDAWDGAAHADSQRGNTPG
jgi:hypothetical protein